MNVCIHGVSIRYRYMGYIYWYTVHCYVTYLPYFSLFTARHLIPHMWGFHPDTGSIPPSISRIPLYREGTSWALGHGYIGCLE